MSNLQINTLTPRTNPNIDIQGLNPPTYLSDPLSTHTWTNAQISAITSATVNSPDPGARFPSSVSIQDQLQQIGAGLVSAFPFTPSGVSIAQLFQALYRTCNPIGKVINGYWTTAPSGTLLLDGAEYSRTTYSGLYNFALTNGLLVAHSTWIGDNTKWGLFSTGNGSTTFRVPNLSGLFIRTRDTSSSGAGIDVDSPRAIGSIEQDMIEAHKHAGGFGEATGPYSFGQSSNGGHVGSNGGQDSDNLLPYTNDGTPVPGDSNTLNPAGLIGTETRPKNIALAAAIYF